MMSSLNERVFKGCFWCCPCLRNPRVLRVHSGFSDFGTPKNPSFKPTLSATYLLKCKIPNYSLRSSTRPNCLTANLLTFGIIKASLSLLSLFKLLASLVIFGCTSAKLKQAYLCSRCSSYSLRS